MLDPTIGPVKWGSAVESRFEFNAKRCVEEAQQITDPDEKEFTLSLAQLWRQLAEAARFRRAYKGGRPLR